METLTPYTQDPEVQSKEQVQITVTKEVIPDEKIVTLSSLDADIKGFDANIVQAQAVVDYWMGRQGELIDLRERVAAEVEKVALAVGEVKP
jgi:hypothetical protein